MGIFLDTCAFCTSIYNEAVLTVSLGIYRYKNDFKSDFPFPRIIAMQGDGKTSYDIARDGVPNTIGECTVRADVYLRQGHAIGCTSTHAFLDANLTFGSSM